MVKKLKKLSLKKSKKSIHLPVQQINSILAKLEDEVEVLVKKLVKQGKKSQGELKRNFDLVLKRVRKNKFNLPKAAELEKEIMKFADEVISKVKELEFLPQREAVSEIFGDLRKKVSAFVELLTANGLIAKAKQIFADTREEVLLKLSIPTQKDVEKLERKIATLERRMGSISKKAA